MPQNALMQGLPQNALMQGLSWSGTDREFNEVSLVTMETDQAEVEKCTQNDQGTCGLPSLCVTGYSH